MVLSEKLSPVVGLNTKPLSLVAIFFFNFIGGVSNKLAK
jgi:hypothetical protein